MPGVLGELVIGEAAARLQHADPVAFLGQSQRTDAAAEPRADNQHIVIRSVVRLHRTSMAVPPDRSECADLTRAGIAACNLAKPKLSSVTPCQIGRAHV